MLRSAVSLALLATANACHDQSCLNPAQIDSQGVLLSPAPTPSPALFTETYADCTAVEAEVVEACTPSDDATTCTLTEAVTEVTEACTVVEGTCGEEAAEATVCPAPADDACGAATAGSGSCTYVAPVTEVNGTCAVASGDGTCAYVAPVAQVGPLCTTAFMDELRPIFMLGPGTTAEGCTASDDATNCTLTEAVTEVTEACTVVEGTCAQEEAAETVCPAPADGACGAATAGSGSCTYVAPVTAVTGACAVASGDGTCTYVPEDKPQVEPWTTLMGGANAPETACVNCMVTSTIPDYDCEADQPASCSESIGSLPGGFLTCCKCLAVDGGGSTGENCSPVCQGAPVHCRGILNCEGSCPVNADGEMTLASIDAAIAAATAAADDTAEPTVKAASATAAAVTAVAMAAGVCLAL